MKYTPRKFFKYNLATDSVTTNKAGKKIVTVNSGDPAASNDTGEGYIVGSMWFNTTSGEQFVATDVSAEDATWAGQLGNTINPPFTVQGSNYGWYAAGRLDPGSPATPGNHNRYALTSSGNGTDIGEANALVEKGQNGSIRNDDFGWHVMGYNPGYPEVIDRFPFSAPTGVTDVGEGSPGGATMTAGNTSGSYGFVSGGYNASVQLDHIYTFPLANPSNPYSDTGGELSGIKSNLFGVSDAPNGYGYVGAGDNPSARNQDTVERFAFTSTGNATDAGEMNAGTIYQACHSSTTHGYSCGGAPWPSYPDLNTIQKFSLASTISSADVSEMTEAKGGCRGSSGPGHGYIAAGADVGPSACMNTIERNSTTSDSAGADVGELTEISMMGCSTES